MPRAGLEPNWGREKPSSGRPVTPHGLVLTRVFLPPCPNPYRRFRAKTALEGSNKISIFSVSVEAFGRSF